MSDKSTYKLTIEISIDGDVSMSELLEVLNGEINSPDGTNPSSVKMLEGV